uniref:Nicotinamide-nucleotide adenylyltransferase 1 n=1 Tax=Arundo donax TaxID=35708 RepID=A0A0A9D0W7_ARUDO
MKSSSTLENTSCSWKLKALIEDCDNSGVWRFLLLCSQMPNQHFWAMDVYLVITSG